MTREEAIKRFDFDMKFKYQPTVWFHITSYKELLYLYKYIKQELNIRTNESYIEFLLEPINYSNINCVVYINSLTKYSDAYAYQFAKNKVDEGKVVKLPDYLINVL